MIHVDYVNQQVRRAFIADYTHAYYYARTEAPNIRYWCFSNTEYSMDGWEKRP